MWGMKYWNSCRGSYSMLARGVDSKRQTNLFNSLNHFAFPTAIFLLQIEDEGNHGNDDTRLFILSTLAGQQKPRVTCALCQETLHVFDRYPLVDGTFFLSPRQHTSSAVEVNNHINYKVILRDSLWQSLFNTYAIAKSFRFVFVIHLMIICYSLAIQLSKQLLKA